MPKERKHVSNIPHRLAVDLSEEFDQVMKRAKSTPVETWGSTLKPADKPETEIIAEFRPTLKLIRDLQMHRGFSFNKPDEYDAHGHADMDFDESDAIDNVVIWVGDETSHPRHGTDEMPKRIVFVQQLGEDITADDIKQQFLIGFSGLGNKEKFLAYRNGLKRVKVDNS